MQDMELIFVHWPKKPVPVMTHRPPTTVAHEPWATDTGGATTGGHGYGGGLRDPLQEIGHARALDHIADGGCRASQRRSGLRSGLTLGESRPACWAAPLAVLHGEQ